MTRPDLPAAEAYAYPLLLKQLWHSALAIHPDQEIVYRDRMRLSYRELRARVGRLANVLAGLGVKPGDTVAVMDWDSHRYLECFYAVPMMGAVLQTVNVRLSPEQILYTLNHARPRLLVLNEEFLPVFREIQAKLETVTTVIWVSDEGLAPPADLRCAGAYEALVARAAPDFAFADLSRLKMMIGGSALPAGLALVVLKPGASAVEDEFRQRFAPLAAEGVISKWAVPDRVLLVESIAKTSVGKFDKKRLREQYASYGSA